MVTQTPDSIVVREPDRNKLVFTRPARSDQAWLLAHKEDPYGNAIQFTYYANRHLAELVDTADRPLTFHYDPWGRLIEIRLYLSPASREFVSLMTYDYDGANDLIAATDRSLVPCTYTYQDHLLTCVTNRIGGHLYYQYDRDRGCVRTWRDGGVQYREIRLHRARLTTALIDSRGYTTLYRNNEKGLTEEEVDPLGAEWRFFYDQRGRLVRTVNLIGYEVRHARTDIPPMMTDVDDLGVISKRTFDVYGNIITRESESGFSTEIEYDRTGNPTKVIYPDGSIEAYTYNAEGNRLSATDGTGLTTRYEYDLNDSLVAIIDPTNRRTTLEYDTEKNLISQNHIEDVIKDRQRVEQYAYDGEDNLLVTREGAPIFLDPGNRAVSAGGGETDCNNLHPLNESVNKSVAATITKCLDKGPITCITVITVMVPGKTTGCRPGGRKCPDV
jgi:YD repeat-containing protein